MRRRLWKAYRCNGGSGRHRYVLDGLIVFGGAIDVIVTADCSVVSDQRWSQALFMMI